MLLDIKYFEPIFLPLQGKLIGYIQGKDNVGGALHQQGALQMFKHFNITYCINNFDKADELVISGGGTMGRPYILSMATLKTPKVIKKKITSAFMQRLKALKTKKKITILPQSFLGREPLPYDTVYVREHRSQPFYKNSILAPDLGLAYTYNQEVSEPTFDQGIWLKTNTYEGCMEHPDNLGDPIANINTITEYINLAAQYKHIITDRCHFAMATLIANQRTQYQRKITLTPNSYHKNLGLWESWLKDLGVKWSMNLE